MVIRAVGLLSPGDMGHSVGRVLVNHGMKVLTCLEGRSDRTKQLARAAGIQDVPSYSALVREVDILLSILVPAQVVNAAIDVARALEDSGVSLTYADCNAISPETKKEVGRIITKAGSHFVDVGIIGSPPGRGGATKFYVSGPQLDEFASLTASGLDIRKVGSQIGQASGLKMTYAAMTKGFTAICTEALTAASKMGLYDTLITELKEDGQRYASMERSIQTMVYRARRWVGEMEEIASTFAHLGLTPKIHQGAADVYRTVSQTPLADETPETLNHKRTLVQTIEIISAAEQHHQ
ncbi:MAG: DUF1932 domain-containing protein [Chloroflexota bacterium]